MKLIENTYKHATEGFSIKVVTCNKRVATTLNLETSEKIIFNRGKLEWMIQKGIFVEIAE